MKTNPHSFHSSRGSVIVTVAILTALMAVLTASIIWYSLNERRGNERNRLQLRAQNVAENISLYAAEQLTTKLYRLGTAPVGHFPWTGNSTSVLHLPPNSVLLSEFNTSTAGMEVRAAIEATTAYSLVNDTTSPNHGLQVATARIPIIAKGTATHSPLGTITSYVEQNMELALTPLFQFGMFYNMDMELYPSANFTVTGPVHTNNSLLAHPDAGSSNTILFTDRVTAADYVLAYQSLKALTRSNNGTNPTLTPDSGNVIFTHTNGTTQTSLKNGSNLWRDCRWLTTSFPPTATQLSNFKAWATTTYNGNLRAGIHGVTKLVLPGIGTYKEADDPSTPEDDRNNGRQIIESPNHKRYNGTSFVTTTDTATLKQIKISWRAGLYIMVNPSSTMRSGLLPDGTTTVYLPPRSYRCWLNTIGINGSHTLAEVVLPGQPSYGQGAGPDGTLNTADDIMYRNDLPNRLSPTTSVGSNQVLRIPQQKHGTGSGYLINNAAGYPIGTTALTVDTGSGTILAGDTVTIGAYKYLVTAPLAANVVTLASPGLRAAVADNVAVVVNAPNVPLGTGSGYLINNSPGPYAIGTTALAVDTGTGTILPGNVVIIGAHKYLVTAATTAAPHTTVWIAAPGLRATVANNVAITLDSLSDTLGTAGTHLVNNAAGYAAGTNLLAIDGGTGTIIPGNTLLIGSNRYLVTSATTASPHTFVTISPGLATAVTDNAEVVLDPYDYTGYRTIGNGGSGAAFPADAATAPYAADAYFFDLRRANGSGAMSTASAASAFGRAGLTFTPRPVAKIDFDMGRFKMMVNRVISSATASTGYKLDLPDASGTGWGNCIYNAAATTASHGLGVWSGSAYDVFPDAANQTRRDPFQLYYAPSSPPTLPADPRTLAVAAADLGAAWYDGVAVYIHSLDAEQRSQTSGVPDRVDSGVRLWNGRGPAPSLTAAGKTGCTIATNDAVYIVGHFNADGTINSNVAATGNGGYSAKYRDSDDEKLCSVFGDALTILAQPVYTQGGAAGSRTYGQTNGWCDAKSALPIAANSSGWNTSAAGGDDGVYNASAIRPGMYPNLNTPYSQGTSSNTKLDAVATEISTALVVGIVPSHHNPTGLTDSPPTSGVSGGGVYVSAGTPARNGNNVNSGGANNFPRLLDDWSGIGLYIRGSIVALFESRVAMEPFTHSRCYRAPGRYWGLHYDFSQANHDVPLEPIVLNATRLGFRRLTAAKYAQRKAAIEALTAIP
jgi:hypothetical protein